MVELFSKLYSPILGDCPRDKARIWYCGSSPTEAAAFLRDKIREDVSINDDGGELPQPYQTDAPQGNLLSELRTANCELRNVRIYMLCELRPRNAIVVCCGIPWEERAVKQKCELT